MSNVVEKINLIKSDPVKNNNKYWKGTLYDNGDVFCEWGRIGYTGQSKMFPGKGRSFLMSKVNDKKRDGRNGEIGYREAEIIDDSGIVSKPSVGTKVNSSELSRIARKQIAKDSKNKEVLDLIDYLTKQNIHNIVSASGGNIKYNYDAGLFQTPLGLVGQKTINEARDVLSDIADKVVAKDYNGNLLELHRNYCMLIPQDMGLKRIDLTEFWFSDSTQIAKQNQILDGLQASLSQAATDKKNADDAVGDNDTDEQVFNTDLMIVEDAEIIKPIFDNFYARRSRQHNCYHYEPIKLWSVKIAPMINAYNKYGVTLSNRIDGYHGTGAENCLSLLKTGFMVRPPSNAAISGKMFGCGIYTAPCHIDGSATKALNYAVGYWGGRSSNRTFMFICDVAMGKYHTPLGPYGGPPKGYDSCWAKGRGKSGVLNDECIVYKESQVNIKYLMELQPSR